MANHLQNKHFPLLCVTLAALSYLVWQATLTPSDKRCVELVTFSLSMPQIVPFPSLFVVLEPLKLKYIFWVFSGAIQTGQSRNANSHELITRVMISEYN